MNRMLRALLLLMSCSAAFADDAPGFMSVGNKVYLQLSAQPVTGVYEIIKVDGAWIYVKRWDGVTSWRNTAQISVVYDCQTDREHISTLERGDCG